MKGVSPKCLTVFCSKQISTPLYKIMFNAFDYRLFIMNYKLQNLDVVSNADKSEEGGVA